MDLIKKYPKLSGFILSIFSSLFIIGGSYLYSESSEYDCRGIESSIGCGPIKFIIDNYSIAAWFILYLSLTIFLAVKIKRDNIVVNNWSSRFVISSFIGFAVVFFLISLLDISRHGLIRF